MPKKPIEPLTSRSFGGCQHSADVDKWLFKYAASFWDNYINFRELSKSDTNKFYHSMRDYYGNGVSVVGFLRSQLKTSKGVFNNGSREAISSGGNVSAPGTASKLGSENPETD